MSDDVIIAHSCAYRPHTTVAREGEQLVANPRDVTRGGWLVEATRPLRAFNRVRYQALRVHPVHPHLAVMSRATLAQARA